MKKIKNILLILTFTLCVIVLPNYINAAPSASNFKLYCGASQIATGQTTNCYLLAKITEDNQVGLFGVYTSITGLDKLTIEKVLAYTPSDVTATRISKGVKNGLGKTCTANADCYDFIAASGKSIRNLGTAKLDEKELNTAAWQGYSVIGYWTVKLDDDATEESCGRFCLSLEYKSTADDQSADGGLSAGGGGCAEIKPVVTKLTCEIKDGKYYGKNGDEVTKDEYQKQCETPKPTCEIKDGKYYDKTGNEVTKDEYQKQCETPNPTCEIKDGKYYDKTGNEVTKDEYQKQCETPNPTCEIKDGKYYDKTGNEVTKDEYQKQCEPQNPTCEIKDGKYYDKTGNEVTKDEYQKQCEPKNPTCEIKDSKYYDKTGNEVTKDEYQKQCETTTPPGTGSFISYLVLIGSALVAVVTVVITKKYNKIFKV